MYSVRKLYQSATGTWTKYHLFNSETLKRPHYDMFSVWALTDPISNILHNASKQKSGYGFGYSTAAVIKAQVAAKGCRGFHCL